jgi:hypothetical protein
MRSCETTPGQLRRCRNCRDRSLLACRSQIVSMSPHSQSGLGPGIGPGTSHRTPTVMEGMTRPSSILWNNIQMRVRIFSPRCVRGTPSSAYEIFFLQGRRQMFVKSYFRHFTLASSASVFIFTSFVLGQSTSAILTAIRACTHSATRSISKASTTPAGCSTSPKV